MERLNIIIDTREQQPWAFGPDVDCSIGTLRTGDYAIQGDDHFAIERKSLDDFLGTIGSGWERFKRELDRMDKAEFIAKIIIVESDFIHTCFTIKNGQIVPPSHNHPCLAPAFIQKRIAELSMMGVSVLFAACPELAATLAMAIFRERNKQL